MIKVAVDAMGGDYAPGEMVAGAVEAVNAKPGIQVLLVGQEQAVVSELSKHTYDKDRIQVVNATEVIATEEPPVNAIRLKPCKTGGGRRLCIRRKFRGNPGRRTGDSGAQQRCGTSPAGTAYSYGEGRITFD